MEKTLGRTELAVVVVYVTQIEGRPTVDEICETIKDKLKFKATKRQIKDAVESTKKRGLLSVNYDHDDKDKMIERYSIKDVRWANPPEVAHIKSVLPKLLETPEAKQIQGMLDGSAEEGQKKGRLPDIRDYVTYKVSYEVLVPILGGEPSPDGKLKLRTLNGDYWLPMNLWFKAAIRLKLRKRNVAILKANYVECTDVFLEKNKTTLVEVARPVAPNLFKAGTGISKHEGLDIGTRFEMDVSFPTKGFMDEKDFLKVLDDNVRIGAKAREYGLLKLVSAEKVKA